MSLQPVYCWRPCFSLSSFQPRATSSGAGGAQKVLPLPWMVESRITPPLLPLQLQNVPPFPHSDFQPVPLNRKPAVRGAREIQCANSWPQKYRLCTDYGRAGLDDQQSNQAVPGWQSHPMASTGSNRTHSFFSFSSKRRDRWSALSFKVCVRSGLFHIWLFPASGWRRGS